MGTRVLEGPFLVSKMGWAFGSGSCRVITAARKVSDNPSGGSGSQASGWGDLPDPDPHSQDVGAQDNDRASAWS